MALNVANTITITAKTAWANVITNSANVLTNISGSSQIYKINNINLSNYSTAAQTATIIVNRGGSGNFYIIGSVAIPGNSMLSVLGKDTSIYLEENDTLQTYASANSTIHLFAGYELLS